MNLKGVKILIVCGVLILAAANAFWMLSKRSLDSHECFVSVTAREMLESGNWILPTLNGQPRINKTPLNYWLVACLAKITGRVNEFAARLPSAVFAFLSAAAVLYFLNRWLSFRIAVISAGVWVTSLSYFRGSHSARPDMALAFFIIICLMSFYSAVTSQTRKQQVVYMLIFWISFGLGNLAKGPAPLAYVFIPMLSYIVIHRQWKVLAKLLPVIGPIIVMVIMLPWPLAIAHKVGWNLIVWKREFFDRLFGEYAQGNYPIYYYFGMMFKYVTPWVAFLPMALIAPFYKIWGEKRPVMQFLWLWFVIDMVFLTIDAGKRQHYLLPLMPAMAILIGILLEDMIFTRKAYTQRFAKNVLRCHIIAIILGAVGGSIYIAIARPQLLVATVAFSIIAIVVILTVAVLFSKRKSGAASGAIFAGIIVGIMVCYAGFLTVIDVDWHARDFAERVAGIVPKSDKLVAYRHASSRFVQYFGKVVPVIQDRSLLYEQYERGNWVACFSDYLKELTEDNCLRQVFYYEKISGLKEDTSGALFHKSSPSVKDVGNSELVEKVISLGSQ